MARGARGRSARQRRSRPPHPSLPHPRHSRPELAPAWPEKGGHDLRERFSRWSGTRLVGHTKVNMSGSLRPAIDTQKDIRVRMLGGTHVGYTKLVDRWWEPIGALLAERDLLQRPIYFVSSNPHGLLNLVSGYVRRQAAALWSFLEQTPEGGGLSEIPALRRARGQSNPENLLYYASRLWHAYHPEAPAPSVRGAEEEERGIFTLAPTDGLDVCSQIIELARLRAEDLDPRLAGLAGVLDRSDAVILNIDYPLGMSAY